MGQSTIHFFCFVFEFVFLFCFILLKYFSAIMLYLDVEVKQNIIIEKML